MVQHRRAEPVPGYGVAVGAPVGALGGWLCLVAAGRHESAAAGVEFGYLIEPCAPHEKPPTILILPLHNVLSGQYWDGPIEDKILLLVFFCSGALLVR